jgi:hypothetical protein
MMTLTVTRNGSVATRLTIGGRQQQQPKTSVGQWGPVAYASRSPWDEDIPNGRENGTPHGTVPPPQTSSNSSPWDDVVNANPKKTTRPKVADDVLLDTPSSKNDVAGIVFKVRDRLIASPLRIEGDRLKNIVDIVNALTHLSKRELYLVHMVMEECFDSIKPEDEVNNVASSM